MTGNHWYYQQGQEAAGPVDTAEIGKRITLGLIERNTNVWTEGMAQWQPLHETSLASLLPATSPLPPPLPPSFPSSGAATRPLQAGRANNLPVWLIAFFPLVFVPVAILSVNTLTGSLLSTAAYIALAVYDREELKKAQLTPSNSYWWMILLGVFGAPVYLYRRAMRTDQNLGYFWTSLATVFAYFLIVIVVVASRMPDV